MGEETCSATKLSPTTIYFLADKVKPLVKRYGLLCWIESTDLENNYLSSKAVALATKAKFIKKIPIKIHASFRKGKIIVSQEQILTQVDKSEWKDNGSFKANSYLLEIGKPVYDLKKGKTLPLYYNATLNLYLSPMPKKVFYQQVIYSKWTRKKKQEDAKANAKNVEKLKKERELYEKKVIERAKTL